MQLSAPGMPHSRRVFKVSIAIPFALNDDVVDDYDGDYMQPSVVGISRLRFRCKTVSSVVSRSSTQSLANQELRGRVAFLALSLVGAKVE